MTGIPTLAILWTLLVQHADHWREDQARTIQQSRALKLIHALTDMCIEGRMRQTDYLDGFPRVQTFQITNVFSENFAGEHVFSDDVDPKSPFSGFGWGRLAVRHDKDYAGAWAIHPRRGIERSAHPESIEDYYMRIRDSLGLVLLRFPWHGFDLLQWQALAYLSDEDLFSETGRRKDELLGLLTHAQSADHWALLCADVQSDPQVILAWKIDGEAVGSWALYHVEQGQLSLIASLSTSGGDEKRRPTTLRWVNGPSSAPFSVIEYEQLRYSELQSLEEVLAAWGAAPKPVPIRAQPTAFTERRGIIDSGELLWYEPVVPPNNVRDALIARLEEFSACC